VAPPGGPGAEEDPPGRGQGRGRGRGLRVCRRAPWTCWGARVNRGYWVNSTWHPRHCVHHALPLDDLLTCLNGKSILLLGPATPPPPPPLLSLCATLTVPSPAQ